ncbi:MAG: acyl-CoA dehydrogenase family protein, partial [Actinomycetota bacterium]
KLFWSETSQKLYKTATDVLGLDGLIAQGDARALDGGRWSRGLLWSRAASIAGGSSEIQRNIIAERILGLPRE